MNVITSRVFVFLFTFCLLGYHWVAADQGPGDDGTQGGTDDRDVQQTVGSSGIQFKSDSKAVVENKVQIDIQVSGSGGPGKRLVAQLQSFTKTSTTKAEVDFTAKFQQLVEYVEADMVPGYSANDTMGATIDLGNINYNFASVSNAPPVYISTATSSSNYFKITCKVGSSLFNDSGVWTFTNGVKIDVDIANFPYTLSNSRLALVMGFVSEKTKFRTVESDNGQPTVVSKRLSVRSGDTSGPVDAYFSWATTVDVTSPAATANVIVGTMAVVANDNDDADTDEHVNMVYSFDAVQPATIHWDPVVGVSNSGANQLEVSAMLSLALFCVLAWIKN